MLKQLLTGGSVLALLLTGGFSAQAKQQEPILQSQVPDTTTTPTTPDATTTPDAESSTSSDASQSANKALCSSNPVPSPSGGDARQRIQAGLEVGQSCN